MPDAARVLPTLLIGGAPEGPAELRALRRRGVTALLSLQTDVDLAARGLSWAEEAAWCRTAGLEAHRLPIEDWSAQAVLDHLEEGVEQIRRLLAEGHTLFVHCTAGVNRSPSLALGYLVRVEGRSVEEALDLLLRIRPGVWPYPEVLEALRRPRRV